MPLKNKAQSFIVQGSSGNIELELDSPKTISITDTTAIVCHPHPLHQGSMHNKVVTTLSKAFCNIGINAVRFNYRGVGKSEGVYGNGKGELDDLCAIANWIHQHKPKQKLILAGFSFGGSIAYKGANKIDQVSHLFTIAPAVTRFPLDKEKEINIPWGIIQGSNDEIVDPQAVFDWLLTAVSGPFHLIKMQNTGHFFHGKLIELRKEIEMYFQGRI